MKIYVVGSLANPNVISVTKALRDAGHEPFSEWMASAEGADEKWKAYGKAMGWDYMTTLKSKFVQTAFNFDFTHMQQADGCVLVMPAGKSAHCEFGWFVGQGKKAYILFDGEPDRPDLMPPNMATGVYFSLEDLLQALIQSRNTVDIDQPIRPRTLRGFADVGPIEWKGNDDFLPITTKNRLEQRNGHESSDNLFRQIGYPDRWVCPTCGALADGDVCAGCL